MTELAPLIDGWRVLHLAAAVPDRQPAWDAVVVTAASPAQAALYRGQMDRLRRLGRVAASTRLEVIADPEGRRIGSGGATIHVLRQLARSGAWPSRILVVHAGGDSRRLPWASILGKAFIPVPLLVHADQGSPSLFEHCLAACAGLPATLPDGGMVCVSGDVLPLVPPADLRPGPGATVIAAPAALTTASRHGVIVATGDEVRDLLQKPDADAMLAAGAVLPGGRALIDTGIWIVAGAALRGLRALAEAADDPVAALLADGRECSLYEEIAAAWLPSRHAWLAGRPLGDRLIAAGRAAPPLAVCVCPRLRFLHFGTGTEVAEHLARHWDGRISRRILSEDGPNIDADAILSHSMVDPATSVGAGTLVHGSRLGAGTRIGRRCAVIGVEVAGEPWTVGDHTAAWQVAVDAGSWVTALAGVDDNPKDTWPAGRFLGRSADAWMSAHDVSATDLWPASTPAEARTGWNARLFPIQAHRSGLAASAWMLAEQPAGDTAGGRIWRNTPRLSLADLSSRLNAQRQLAASADLDAALLLARLSRVAAGAVDGDGGTLARQLPANLLPVAANLADQVEHRARLAPHRRHRLVADLARAAGLDGAVHEQASWAAVAAAVAEAIPGAASQPIDPLPAGRRARADLPVRLDLAGGWSDTPPYCLEHPARVLNLAVELDGRRPVGCQVESADGSQVSIRLHDGAWHRLDAAAVLAPARVDDPLVLARLALQACGYIADGRIVQAVTLDGWSRVPKGSGLGGSSILAAAMVQALQRLAGRPDDPATVSERVLLIEQRLSSGGGWQDQLGALVPGAKLLSSLPVRPLRIQIEPVPIDPDVIARLQARLLIVHTGIDRLARNVLQRVMGSYLSRDRTVVTGIERLADLADTGRRLLADGDLDGLGGLLGEVWSIHQQLDPHCSNPAVEALFAPLAGHLGGWKLVGAGGGGFAILLARSPADAAQVSAHLGRLQHVSIHRWSLATQPSTVALDPQEPCNP
jgi:fucokinase